MTYNTLDRPHLEARLQRETLPRQTLSFYRYCQIDDPGGLREELFQILESQEVLGRVFLASEGVNGQISVPKPNFLALKSVLEKIWPGLPLKTAVEEASPSFIKLVVKVRKKVVADGLDAGDYDMSDRGQHLNAAQWNEAISSPESVIVDMRNYYESEVGRFEGAVCPDVDTFREQIPMVKDLLLEQKEKKILLYCTGGIRCEKTAAYLRKNGFQDVNSLDGGIINYVNQVRKENLTNFFRGKNFVFDNRLGERITEEILSSCHQCGQPCDSHHNCANDGCHQLFIQCPSCNGRFSGCCSQECQNLYQVSSGERRRVKKRLSTGRHHKSRLRPRI